MTRIRSLLLLSVASFALLPLTGSGRAGCRSVVAHHQQQLVVGYTPAYPAQSYYVGGQLQLQASEDRIAQKAAALVVQQLTAQALKAEQSPPVPQPETLPLTAEVDRWALVKASCVGCHATNEKAREAMDMTDLSALTCEQKLACIAAVLDGRMPKSKKLDPQTLGNLLGEFAGAETAHQP